MPIVSRIFNLKGKQTGCLNFRTSLVPISILAQATTTTPPPPKKKRKPKKPAAQIFFILPMSNVNELLHLEYLIQFLNLKKLITNNLILAKCS